MENIGTYIWWGVQILGGLVVFIFLYELIRYRIKRRLARRFRRSVREFIDRHNITIERSRLMAKQLVRQDLLNDREVNQAIIEHAEERDLDIESVREIVEEYIDEIVPAFNLLSYYKVAYTLARGALNLVYDVVIDQESLKKLEDLPEDVVQVYVMNHRSNADFVLAAYMLSRSICVSFAVGEWARIWPLENLFKSFGSYFVRRGYRENLYHVVLARYLGLITKRGLNQGIFIEGGLSRDGRLRKPKFGLLDYIIKASGEEEFLFKDVYFIPTGINFDWVLEDRNLLVEKGGKKPRRSIFHKLWSLLKVLVALPFVAITNFFRFITGRIKRFGYGSVSFGEPVSLADYIEDRDLDFSNLEGEERKEKLFAFANHLLDHVGEVIPVTPVPLLSQAFLSFEEDSISKAELLGKIREVRRELHQRGARIVMGREFEWYQQSKEFLKEEEEVGRNEELLSVEKGIVESEASEKIYYLAMEILKRRKILGRKDDQVFLHKGGREILEYYAYSIGHLLEE